MLSHQELRGDLILRSELDKAGIKFITLRNKGKNVIVEATGIPEGRWKKFYLPISKVQLPNLAGC